MMLLVSVACIAAGYMAGVWSVCWAYRRMYGDWIGILKAHKDSREG